MPTNKLATPVIKHIIYTPYLLLFMIQWRYITALENISVPWREDWAERAERAERAESGGRRPESAETAVGRGMDETDTRG